MIDLTKKGKKIHTLPKNASFEGGGVFFSKDSKTKKQSFL